MLTISTLSLSDWAVPVVYSRAGFKTTPILQRDRRWQETGQRVAQLPAEWTAADDADEISDRCCVAATRSHQLTAEFAWLPTQSTLVTTSDSGASASRLTLVAAPSNDSSSPSRSAVTRVIKRWPYTTSAHPGAYYFAPVEERSIAIGLSVCVCLSASISLEPLDRSSRNFVCRYPVAVARSSSGGAAIVMYFRFYGWRHVWPWWAVWQLAALRYRGGGLVSMNTLFLKGIVLYFAS